MTEPANCTFLLYSIGYYIEKRMLISEFLRKTQLEADQIAAWQIQQTLIPRKLPELPDYEVEAFLQRGATAASTGFPG